MNKVRVVLADDHREVIANIRAILGDEFEIVGVAENGIEAVSVVLELDPDVFVTDISMPLLDGLQAARRIQNVNSQVKIIFVTIYEDQEFIAAAFSAGAMGYVTKSQLSNDLVFAIQQALEGLTFVSNSLPI